MSDWLNENLALQLRYSANLQVNIPQSDPFICCGIFLTIRCFHSFGSSSEPFLAECSCWMYERIPRRAAWK